MKKHYLFLVVSLSLLTACSSSQPTNNSSFSNFSSSASSISAESSSSSQNSESSSVKESTSSEPVEEFSSSTNLTWSSIEDAIEFYEANVIADRGKEMGEAKLNMEFYEGDSWELISQSGDTIVLSMNNVPIGGKDRIKFVKGKTTTEMTFFSADSSYPDRPTSRKIVQNSDFVTIDSERLNPSNHSLPPSESTEPSLSDYSSEEIEYARVWLEVIGTTDIDELMVSYRSKGDPVNRFEKEKNTTYPEDVIILETPSAIVTYSGNGDGTINLYDLPLSWYDGILPKGKTMKEYTVEIINNPILVDIGVGEDEDVIKLITKETIQK